MLLLNYIHFGILINRKCRMKMCKWYTRIFILWHFLWSLESQNVATGNQIHDTCSILPSDKHIEFGAFHPDVHLTDDILPLRDYGISQGTWKRFFVVCLFFWLYFQFLIDSWYLTLKQLGNFCQNILCPLMSFIKTVKLLCKTGPIWWILLWILFYTCLHVFWYILGVIAIFLRVASFVLRQ